MALAATVLQAVRHNKNTQKLDQWEHRKAQFGFLRMFQKDTPNLLNARIIEQAKMAPSHVQQAIVTNKGTVVINNVRSCTIQPKENTSALLTFVWATYSFDFTMRPMQYYNNEIEYASDMAQKMEEGDEALASTFETGAFNAANAAKNVAAVYNGQTPYSVVGDFMTVPQASKFDFYNQLKVIFKLHNFRQSGINVVGSTLAEADVIRYGINGSLKNVGVPGNAGNQAVASIEDWQLFGYNWMFSENIPAVAGVQSRLFASAPGSYGIMNWNPKAFQIGGKTSDGTTFEQTPAMPLTGMQLGHQYKTTCLNGDELQEFHQFSTDVCFTTAYNSDPATKAGSIFEARVTNA
jgi:hypothetical protein